jgi:uncharacterized protein
MNTHYKFFINTNCSYFPCHDLPEWKSCLFCWCPLYLLDCGGDFVIRKGVKDCTPCVIPHSEKGYDYVLGVVSRTIYKKKNEDSADQLVKKTDKPQS